MCFWKSVVELSSRSTVCTCFGSWLHGHACARWLPGASKRHLLSGSVQPTSSRVPTPVNVHSQSFKQAEKEPSNLEGPHQTSLVSEDSATLRPLKIPETLPAFTPVLAQATESPAGIGQSQRGYWPGRHVTNHMFVSIKLLLGSKKMIHRLCRYVQWSCKKSPASCVQPCEMPNSCLALSVEAPLAYALLHH